MHIYSKQSMTTTHVRHFNQLLYELRRDGLVNMDKTQRTFTITRSGLLWLKKCKDNIPFTMPQYKPVIVKSDRIIIVSYDILEKSKIFAEWIRRSLKTFGLQQLQRSVWVGKTQLPEEFISDLSRLRLINYIEIFEVTKSGSLRQKM